MTKSCELLLFPETERDAVASREHSAELPSPGVRGLDTIPRMDTDIFGLWPRLARVYELWKARKFYTELRERGISEEDASAASGYNPSSGYLSRRSRIAGALIFIAGLAIGGGGVQSYHRFHEKRTAEVFSRRLRCKELADQYEKKESSTLVLVNIGRVDYSLVSNSCVVSVHELRADGKEPAQIIEIVDPLSGEQLYSDRKNPGNADELMQQWHKERVAFDQAVNGQEVNVRNVK
ncbi:MAG: hypothetical protein WAK02_01370 [Terriglobales bacterium]